MKKYTHNKVLDSPDRFWVGDIESSLNDDKSWNLELSMFTNGLDFFESDSITDTFNFLNNQPEPVTIYYHNLDFDLLFYLQNKDISGLMRDTPMITSGGKIIALTIENVTFLNSLMLLPMALKKVVKVFLGVNDQAYFNQKQNVLDLSPNELRSYCADDVYYTFQALIKLEDYFIEHFDTKLKLTLPALAFKVYYSDFIPNKKYLAIENRNEAFFKDNYYFGGHTEKFIEGKYVFRRVRYYDVNSLYPDRMKNLRFIKDKKVRTAATIKRLKQLIKNDECFYCRVDVNIDSENLRFFPVFNENEFFNSYPTGIHTLKLSEIGIAFILRWGDWSNIVEVRDILISKELSTKKKTTYTNLFFAYVAHFYELRKSSKVYDVIAKLLLNSLYGKFGENIKRASKIINRTEERGDLPTQVQKLHDQCYIETFDDEIPFYNRFRNRLDIAGKITESGRLVMGDYINQLREYGEVYYTDTDSIITNVDISKVPELKHLLSETKLGKLSDEIGYIDNVIILGLKMYSFYKSKKQATKGIKVMTHENFREVIRGKTEFTNTRFSKLGVLINKGFFGLQKVPYSLQKVRERLD